MHYKELKRLKELAFRLYSLSSEILAIFAEEERAETEKTEQLKKSPKIESSIFRE